MKTKHTIGPWKIRSCGTDGNRGYYNFTIEAQNGSEIVSTSQHVLGKIYPEIEANAKLIAASPELLEACKLGLAAMIAWGGKCEANGEHILARESVIQAETIRAAIAKAV